MNSLIKRLFKIKTLILFAIVSALPMCIACNLENKIVGTGVKTNKQIDLNHFQAIEIGSSFDVNLIQGGKSQIILHGDENLLNYVQVQMKDQTLVVTLSQGITLNQTIKVTITSSAIEHLTVHGHSEVTCLDLKCEKLFISTHGSSQITLEKIDCNYINAHLHGSTCLRMGGKCSEIKASLNGTSGLKASRLQVERADFALNGAAEATIDVSSYLTVSLNGAGRFFYSGSPQYTHFKTSGSSQIVALDQKNHAY